MKNLILGIDEVGRGSLAGPLCIGACILRPRTTDTESWQSELTDSKRLSKKHREILATKIKHHAVAFGLGSVSPAEIDRFGLASALQTATRLAVIEILKNFSHPELTHPQNYSSASEFSAENLKLFADLPLPFNEIIIDGPQNFLKNTFLSDKVTNLNKADLLIKEVSAASIIAKVYRDNLMIKLATDFPDYDFIHNVGYGTKNHLSALNKFGPCPLHRFSVRPVKKAYAKNGMNPKYDNSSRQKPSKTKQLTQLKPFTAKSLGDRAESVVADYLEKSGHKILIRNLKTHNFEIDIISEKQNKIYFTEVKYRKSGNPLDAITPRKRQKMTIAANAVMTYLAGELNCSIENLPAPILAVASVSGPNFHLNAWFPI